MIVITSPYSTECIVHLHTYIITIITLSLSPFSILLSGASKGWFHRSPDSSASFQCDADDMLLVFMIRSIFHGWSQIIGHHFTRSVFQKKDLSRLLDAYLSALDTFGLMCRAVICDQEPSHVSMFRDAVSSTLYFFYKPYVRLYCKFGLKFVVVYLLSNEEAWCFTSHEMNVLCASLLLFLA